MEGGMGGAGGGAGGGTGKGTQGYNWGAMVGDIVKAVSESGGGMPNLGNKGEKKDGDSQKKEEDSGKEHVWGQGHKSFIGIQEDRRS